MIDTENTNLYRKIRPKRESTLQVYMDGKMHVKKRKRYAGISGWHDADKRRSGMMNSYILIVEEEDKLLGYELGADDYVAKPFAMSVLYAKTMALIKRNRKNVLSGDRMEAGGITLEISRRKVFAGKFLLRLHKDCHLSQI